MKFTHCITPLLVAGAALASAPVAESAPTGPICVGVGQSTTQCQTNGHAEINTSPPPRNYPQYPFFGPYSLLFHHGGHRR